MTYKLIPTVEDGTENPIIQSLNQVSLDTSEVEVIVGAIIPMQKLIRNAKIENKLNLLTGKYVGKESEIYIREECLNWFEKYMTELPVKLQEAMKEKILEESKQKSK